MDAKYHHLPALLNSSSRVAILGALMEGIALPASELAYRAGITNQTASAHLTLLSEAGLLEQFSSGRHRYYRIRSAEVAATLEHLSSFIPQLQNKPREKKTLSALHQARMCYDHLAGFLGVSILDNLLQNDLLQVDHSKPQNLMISAKGKVFFSKLGIDYQQEQDKRRRFAYSCLDWSERRPHLGGSLAAALATIFLNNGWVNRIEDSRALVVKDTGIAALHEHFTMKWKQ